MARIYCGDEIDDALRKRLASHRAVLPIDTFELLAVYDRSAFGRAKAGIIFTDSSLIIFDDEAQEILYSSVQQAQWQVSEQWSLVSLSLHLSTGETWTHDLNVTSEELSELVDILGPQLPFVDWVDPSAAHPPIVVKPSVPVSTTDTVAGRKIAAMHGPVFGEAEVAVSTHGAPSLQKNLLALGRQRAVDLMVEGVDALGGQAVIGLRVDHIALNDSRLLITAVGTAVSLVNIVGPYR